MKTLFHRYNSIVEPDVMEAFKKFDIEIIEDDAEIYNKNIDSDTRIQTMAEAILTQKPDFVFSINYFPYISQICEKLNCLYVCLSVDCPVLEIYSDTIRNKCNRVFLFDYNQYESIVNENPEGIFYLPLATNVDRWENVLGVFNPKSTRYQYDVSFVGSLYTEKSPYRTMYHSLDGFTKGYLDGVLNAQMKMTGLSVLEEVFAENDMLGDLVSSNGTATEKLARNVLADLKSKNMQLYDKYSLKNSLVNTDIFATVQNVLGFELSARDRIELIEMLGSNDVETYIFTRSSDDFKNYSSIHLKGGVSTHKEMPQIFRNSKININQTMRCIQAGLPQRIWDIMGCGGFCLTNYQSEIPEYFEIGKDIACYENSYEAVSLIKYFLEHEDERMEIAYNGYNKVKNMHTYEIRVAQMLKAAFESKF